MRELWPCLYPRRGATQRAALAADRTGGRFPAFPGDLAKAGLGLCTIALLAVVGTIMLAPFAWLICAAFKDKDVLNKYAFLPPPHEISHQTVNLDNFRDLFTANRQHQWAGQFLAIHFQLAVSGIDRDGRIRVLLFDGRIRDGQVSTSRDGTPC